MSRATSSFTGRLYGVVRVTREWEMARSSFYHQRALAARPDRVLRRRGPKTAWSDVVLLGKIREVLAASPFYGEGHRKVWARLLPVRTVITAIPTVRMLPQDTIWVDSPM
jgi:putative transposase